MQKNLITILLLMLFLPVAEGQSILTLKECYAKAEASNALATGKEKYSSIWQLKDNNLSKGWLPTLDAGGSFVYNSEVVDMSSIFSKIPITGLADAIEPLPHEQYKITLELNQVIYDGGAIKSARNLEKTELTINQKQTETDMYKIKSQINTCYFSVLLIKSNKELLESYHNLITKRITTLQSALNNGVITKTDIDVLTSEKIKIEQQLAENEIKKSSLLKVLSNITGSEINASTGFVLPRETNTVTADISRPELQIFDLRKEQLAAGIKVIESKRMPKAYGFATLGYGNPPGSNFFKDEFAPYYLFGASVKWNIFDWNKSKNEKQVVTLQQEIIENKKADLTDNLNRMLESKSAEIASLELLISSDSELIAIRKRITASAASQYDNGTITATDYLNEMNSERQVVINNEIHKINLALARIEYLNISGKEIE